MGATQRRERITAPAAPSLELSDLGLGETLVAATSVHVDHARQTFVTSVLHPSCARREGPRPWRSVSLRSSLKWANRRSSRRLAPPYAELGLGGPRCGGAARRRCGRDSFTALRATPSRAQRAEACVRSRWRHSAPHFCSLQLRGSDAPQSTRHQNPKRTHPPETKAHASARNQSARARSARRAQPGAAYGSECRPEGPNRALKPARPNRALKPARPNRALTPASRPDSPSDP